MKVIKNKKSWVWTRGQEEHMYVSDSDSDDTAII